MSLKLITAGAVAAGFAVLAGCTTPGKPASPGSSPMPGAPAGSVCNADGAQFAVGKAAGASTTEQARQRSGAYMARILRPGQVVTMEFNAQRLNLDVDAAGVIKRVRCG